MANSDHAGGREARHQLEEHRPNVKEFIGHSVDKSLDKAYVIAKSPPVTFVCDSDLSIWYLEFYPVSGTRS